MSTRKTTAPFRPQMLGALALLGCAASPPPEPRPAEAAPVASTAPVTVTTSPATTPAADEPAKTEEAKKLEAEWAQMEAEAQAERQRWTPELRQQAKLLAAESYPSTKAGVQAALKGSHRVPGNAERDVHRHPVETLEFLGVKPNMTVLEYGPGEGWYTELLAPLLAQKGKLIVTTGNPEGPRDVRDTFYAQRFRHFLEKAPEVYGKVESIAVDSANPSLGLEGTLDMALVIRGMHGWKRRGTTSAWLGTIFRALKPGGLLGVVQHRAAAGADPEASAQKGYLPEAWVIDQAKQAGFKLVAKSELNANPKDTKDHPEGVWTLPPTYRLGDTDREKYAAIGESDRMTLKFAKVGK